MSGRCSGALDKFPAEVLGLVLDKYVEKNKRNKNDVLPLRLVCKRFDAILREKLLKTIQLDFDRLSSTGHPADLKYLDGIGHDVKALVVDLSVIRSQSEIKDLRAAFSSITGRIPDTKLVLEKLNLHCMGEETFDESDFKDLLTDIFNKTPNLTKIKVNLPFKIVGQAPIHTTTLFANALECIALRKEHNEKALDLQTLVIGHFSDTTLNKIYGNPMDLKNALTVFKPLIHLVVNIKRQEYDNSSQASFQAGFQRLLSEASNLKSLCITGWNANRVTRQRASQGANRVERDKWAAQCLPYHTVSDSRLRLEHLQYLELKRIDIEARALMGMIFDCSKSLKELYLNQVYLKHDQRSMPNIPYLWVGHGADVVKSPGDLWIADEIKKLRDAGSLKLTILRASALGYDYINPAQGAVRKFDLEDPSGTDRSFDERFVQRAMDEAAPGIDAAAIPPVKYDVRATQLFHNTTSSFFQTLDGMFNSYSSQSLGEIVKIVAVVDNSMKQLTSQLEAVNRAGDGKPPSTDGDNSDSSEDDDDDT